MQSSHHTSGCLIGDTPSISTALEENQTEGATHQPAMSHHLFSHTSGPGSHLLIWNHTRHPPAVLDLRLKVNNIKVGRIKNQQHQKLGNTDINHNSDKI